MDASFWKKHAVDILVLLIIIPMCILPMGLSPVWNGQEPYYRTQYEKMADALLDGHIYLNMEVSDEMLALENPYDIDARISAGASTANLGMDDNWDHAYYKGKYYMYFGVVPAIVLFVPYKFITGHSLTTYHATQVFTAFIILGLFIIFSFLQEKLFKGIPRFVMTFLKIAFSMISVWYFIGTPAMYCTAQSGAVCFSVWSVYFFLRAVFDRSFSYNKKIVFATIGALCGALVFGCRPSIGFISLAFIPLLMVFIQDNNMNSGKIWKLMIVFVPYIVVGVFLMLYNYLRFENVFEFGQSYQITIADQHEYSLFSGFSYDKMVSGFKEMLFVRNKLDKEFPYLCFSGIFVEFPILILGFVLLISGKVRRKLKEAKLLGFVYFLIITVLIIVFADIMMSPFIIERYHEDVLFVLAILMFTVVGALYNAYKKTKLWNIVFVLLSVATIVSVILLFFVPNDSNYTAYYPNVLSRLREIFPDIRN